MRLGLARLDPARRQARGGLIEPVEGMQGEAKLVMRVAVLRRSAIAR